MTYVTESNAALLTDLYELTMADSYHRHGMTQPATFDLFVRHLPEERNFLVACGLDDALQYLEHLRFGDAAITYLDSLGIFSEGFLQALSTLRFTGDVWAIPEGEVAFAAEPLLRVTAPLIEAQIVETYLLNSVLFQTMVASKAARVALACGDKTFIDFSPRRDHGADAALKAARAAYVGGASATSNVLAGHVYGIEVSGTMAHSYVMAFEDEYAAFRAFARDFPERAVLLIDTFDVEEGARRAVRVARELADEGVKLKGVRIDSGKLADLARSVRKILDDEGFFETQIVLSGDLDEYLIEKLVDDGAPVDSFGVGTQLGTSGDAPTLGGVYKLVADERGPKMKLSAGKSTLPDLKQVYRVSRDGRIVHDTIALASEPPPEGAPLLRHVMANGSRTDPPESLEVIRDRCRAALKSLPPELTSINRRAGYPVRRSAKLDSLVQQMEATAH
jgi:nicotinate phosphoribosyltransferase